MATADIGSYAAYGRMVVLGQDPYVTAPRDLPDDPVAGAAEAPWLDAPSVYGPLAAGEQALLARVAGTSRAAVLHGLAAVAAAAFLAVGLLLDLACRSRPDPLHRRRIAALLWTLNPLLILQLVAAAHVDGLLCLAVLAGVLLAAGRPGRAGLAIGLAGCLKATAVVPGLGLAVALRQPSRLVRYALGAAVVLLTAYPLAGGWHVLSPARQASRSVSRGTPWRWVASGLERLMPHAVARDLVVYAAAAAAVVLAVRLARRLPPGPASEVRSAFVAVTAWTLMAPYALPWYDGLAWCLLAAAVATSGSAGLRPYAVLLAVHTGVLTLAYLPGRTVPLGPALQTLLDATRSDLAPIVVLAVLLAAWAPVGWAWGRLECAASEDETPTEARHPRIVRPTA
jgi:hypothetical protein